MLLVAVAAATCGSLALCLGCLAFFLRLFKMYHHIFSVAADMFYYNCFVPLKLCLPNTYLAVLNCCIRYEEYLESIVKRSVGLKEEDDSDLLLGIHFQVIHQG